MRLQAIVGTCFVSLSLACGNPDPQPGAASVERMSTAEKPAAGPNVSSPVRATAADGVTSELLRERSYRDMYDQGLMRYVGAPEMAPTEVTRALFSAIDVHHFSGANRGPLCMHGAEYFVETRAGSSDTLLIFLQGGGVCLRELCAATPDPLLSLRLYSAMGLIGLGGLLDARNADNPARDFDVVNAPYCDGSLFAGDVDRVLAAEKDGTRPYRAFQRGLQNLTATLETAHRSFPRPSRVVLAGSSGGAYGVLVGAALARHFYPHQPILVLSDSGAPIANGVDKAFITRALTELNILRLIPRSCPDCLANGHATGVVEWTLRADPNLTVAYMTHARDHVIGEFFMRTSADQFRTAVVEETDRLLRDFPGRAFRFVIPSRRHTLLMGIDGFSAGIQGSVLGIAVSLGIGFVGPDVTAQEFSAWSVGGLREVALDATGRSWDGYRWIRKLLEDPTHTPNVLQLE